MFISVHCKLSLQEFGFLPKMSYVTHTVTNRNISLLCFIFILDTTVTLLSKVV